MAQPSSNVQKSGTASVFVTAIVVIIAFLVLPRIFASKNPLEGTSAAAWSLPLVANVNPVDDMSKQLSLTQLQGKPVVLDFWATWCGPCRDEAPILERFSRKHAGEVVVVGVNTDDGPGLGGAWARKQGLSYPIVFDGESATKRAYKVTALPTLVIVSRVGKIVGVRVGVTDEGELEDLLAKAQ